MARLVPALPRQNLAQAERDLTLAIEDQLEDQYLLFQPTPARGAVIAHPEEGVFAFVCMPGLRPSGGGWVDSGGNPVDPEQIAAAAAAAFREIAGEAAAGCSGLVFVPDLPKGLVRPPMVAGLTPIAIADSVLAACKAAPPAAMPGAAGLERLLQTLAPGTSPYAGDAITEAQAAWRAQRLEMEAEALAAAAQPVAEEEPDRAILKMIDLCVNQALNGAKPWLQGLPLRESEISSPRHLLAPLIVATAESWAPIVAGRGGRGGFHLRLRPDEESLLYFRVVEIIPSAPLLLYLPMVNLLRRSCRGDLCVLDDVVGTFRRWLIKHGLEGIVGEDIEVRIATSS